MILLPHFTRALVTRALLLWAFTRAVVSAASAALAGSLQLPQAHPLLLTPGAALALIAVVTAAAWVFTRHRNEEVFLRMLGYGRARLLATLAVPLLVLEVVLGIAVRAG